MKVVHPWSLVLVVLNRSPCFINWRVEKNFLQRNWFWRLFLILFLKRTKFSLHNHRRWIINSSIEMNVALDCKSWILEIEFCFEFELVCILVPIFFFAQKQINFKTSYSNLHLINYLGKVTHKEKFHFHFISFHYFFFFIIPFL